MSYGNLLVVSAFKEKDVYTLKRLKSLGINIENRGKLGKTILMRAIESKDLAMIRFISENDLLDIEEKDFKESSPLKESFKDIELFKALCYGKSGVRNINYQLEFLESAKKNNY